MKFYAHGKLLISSEYLVLDGAPALALPTKLGQHLEVNEINQSSDYLHWKALNSEGQPWLSATFRKSNLELLSDSNQSTTMLQTILATARKMNPTAAVWLNAKDFSVETRLEFPNAWGLGSSSTLMALLQQWLQVDGIQLLRHTMGGSGYDIAAGLSDNAIVYTLGDEKPRWTPVSFSPSFADQLYFVYTGKKQLSSSGIASYRDRHFAKAPVIEALERLTEALLNATTLDAFEAAIQEHEALISNVLGMAPVQQTYFADYWGTVKSLGAWGGDFVLLTNNRGHEALHQYLQQKGMPVYFSFHQLIFSSSPQ
ncbi:MAG: GYDIA family GHMP kinase [Chitinophagales bacterium]